MNRRKFLAASSVATLGAGAVAKSLGADGKPVREKPLRADYWGPEFYDEKERQELLDVHSSRRLFRWYGPGDQPPMKVATFEKEFAARMQTRFALAVTSGTAA